MSCSVIPIIAIYNTELCSSSQATVRLLTKLHLELSHETSATLFALSDAKSVNRVLESARSALVKYFIINNLGFRHISRGGLIRERTKLLAKPADNQDKV